MRKILAIVLLLVAFPATGFALECWDACCVGEKDPCRSWKAAWCSNTNPEEAAYLVKQLRECEKQHREKQEKPEPVNP